MNAGRGRTADAATRARRTVLAAVGALVAVLASTGFASDPAGDSVASFDAVVDVDGRGDVHVTETIEYVFGAPGHGLSRELPTMRTRPIVAVTAESPSGAPSAVRVTDLGALIVIRVGDPGRTVTGRQTYVLRYTVAGAIDRVATSPSYDGLSLDVIGSGWDVPIDRVWVRVTAPRPATAVSCFLGPWGTYETCPGVPGPTSTFSAVNLPARHGVTVALSYPLGMIPGPDGAERGQPTAWGRATGYALLIVAVVGLGLLVRYYRVNRTAAAAAATAASAAGASRLRSWRPPPSSRATPHPAGPRAPGGLRPGQLATLHDARPTPLAVTATLVDLAARGFLRIRTVPGARGRPDWLLIATPRPADDPLLPYEETLLDAVFADQSSALLGSLHHRSLGAVRQALATDAVAHGRLRATVRKPLGAGRTPAGDALVVETARFREELETAFPDGSTDDDARAFDRWLPYAIVLGTAEDWVDRFRTSVGDRWDLRWYAVSRRIAATGKDAADDTGDGVLRFTTAMCDGVTSGPSWSGGSDHSSGSGGSDWSGGGGGGDWSGGGGGGGGGGSGGGGS